MEHLLARAGAEGGRAVRFNAEAKAAYLRFATGPEALWSGNFRDLAASVTRLATLAEAGRIGESLVQAEVARLRWLWQPQGVGAATAPDGEAALPALVGAAVWDAMDLFDRLQLQAVAGVCRRARSLSDAGRVLFQASRTQRSVVNDADRLRKYLARFGLTWEQVAGA